ncbi:MAG TPA: PIN domain-containing protein [Anaerolineae bacterium]|nr:PIN domain-containing protein [Anaerolineae bacterium]
MTASPARTSTKSFTPSPHTMSRSWPMNEKMIIDASALYAVVDRRDPNHMLATPFLRSFARQGVFLLSNHVFDEIMTLVKMRLGVSAALQLGMRLRNSRHIEMVIFGQREEMATWHLFSRYMDKGWSYTDCASLALARQLGVQQAFTFDHHFSQMGLLVYPQ